MLSSGSDRQDGSSHSFATCTLIADGKGRRIKELRSGIQVAIVFSEHKDWTRLTGKLGTAMRALAFTRKALRFKH